MPDLDSEYRSALPSVRVHRVFHRLGVVLASMVAIVAFVSGGAGAYSLATANEVGARFGFGWMLTLFVVALVFYVLCRAIGWIVAGAMKY